MTPEQLQKLSSAADAGADATKAVAEVLAADPARGGGDRAQYAQACLQASARLKAAANTLLEAAKTLNSIGNIAC
jgi:hypothetical protein